MKFVRGGGRSDSRRSPAEVRRRLAVGEQYDQAVLDAFAEEVVTGQRVEGGEGRRLVLESLRRRPLDADRLRQSSREELLVPVGKMFGSTRSVIVATPDGTSCRSSCIRRAIAKARSRRVGREGPRDARIEFEVSKT